MKYGSVCSGIESATVAWHPLGWRAAFYAEIDTFPSAVLAHYYPEVPNLGDITRFENWGGADIDVLVGGTPCQSFSVAGLRTGLDDPRGNLMLTYLAIARRYRPRWVAWENVPGVLSIDNGRAFGAFLGGLAKLGYGWAYRILDAQFFELAQRRARVFVVGCLGGWRGAAAVLFERTSLSGNPPPSRGAREDVAGTVTSSTGKRRPEGDSGQLVARSLMAKGGSGRFDAESETYICFDETQITNPDNRCNPQLGDPSHPLAAAARPPTIAFNARQDVDHWEERSGPIDTDGTTQAIAQPYTLASRGRGDGHQLEYRQDGIANAILTPNGGRGGIGVGAIATRWAVRRLTPLECERLQGFEDNYTLIPYRGKPAKDGPRYKALGNSKAVPVVRWIGRRIEMVDEIIGRRAA